MTKENISESLAARTGLSKKDSRAAVNALFEILTDAMARGEKIQVTGFGTFDTSMRAARTAKNMRTGETIQVPATKVPRFKAGKTLKDAVK
jgi:DNA-binding protein HU-beta